MADKKIRYLTLKYLRSRLGIKQCEFAKMIGLSVGQYNKKENGHQNWTLSECEIIRDFINPKLIMLGEKEKTIDEIFFGEEVSNTTQKIKRKVG